MVARLGGYCKRQAGAINPAAFAVIAQPDAPAIAFKAHAGAGQDRYDGQRLSISRQHRFQWNLARYPGRREIDKCTTIHDDHTSLMKFIIVIAGYNVAPFIAQALSSVTAQTRSDWVCVYCDDCSTDGSADVARRTATGDARIHVIENSEKKYLLRNTVDAIHLAHPDPEDVVVCLDGDDWLAHNDVLARLAREYEQGAWMTYGSYATSIGGAREEKCTEYPAWVTSMRLFRWMQWRASHLKSFKVWLWHKIDSADLTITQNQMRAFARRKRWTGLVGASRRLSRVELHDLVDPSGRYFRRCVDKVTMFPMLEMAGNRAHHIQEVLYIYNQRVAGVSTNQDPVKDIPRYSNRFIRQYLKTRPRYKNVYHRTPEKAVRISRKT